MGEMNAVLLHRLARKLYGRGDAIQNGQNGGLPEIHALGQSLKLVSDMIDEVLNEERIAALVPASSRTAEPCDHADKICIALTLIDSCSQIDGEHHKQWLIDQVARALLRDNYDEFVRQHKAGEDGPDTYSWSEGIAP